MYNIKNKWSNKFISLATLEPMARINLRAELQNIKEINELLGIELPQAPKQSYVKNNKHALWLGPDEWLIIANENDEIKQKLLKQGNATFSCVDVSDNFCAIEIKGLDIKSNAVRLALSGACPQNLQKEIFGKGACSRTLFGKAAVVLYCLEENIFHLHFGRSFSQYVWQLLVACSKDAQNITQSNIGRS